MTPEELSKSIDHTLLRANATIEDVRNFCEEGKKYNFASVCLSPCYLDLAKKYLQESPLKVTTVVGFPLGTGTTATKCFEAKDAIHRGAQELDMVLNIGALKSGHFDFVLRDMEAVARIARREEVESSFGYIIVKVIIESCYLTDNEKKVACQLIKKAGADFVKTSTGFGSQGATVPDVKLLRKSVSSEIGVKASGGIQTYDQAVKMLQAGATRIGTSSGVKIMKEFLKTSRETKISS